MMPANLLYHNTNDRGAIQSGSLRCCRWGGRTLQAHREVSKRRCDDRGRRQSAHAAHRVPHCDAPAPVHLLHCGLRLFDVLPEGRDTCPRSKGGERPGCVGVLI